MGCYPLPSRRLTYTSLGGSGGIRTVSRLVMGRTWFSMWLRGITNILAKSTPPGSYSIYSSPFTGL